MSTVEVLRTARESVREGPYAHWEWERCLCGHVYAAAVGREGRRSEIVRGDEPSYARALRALGVPERHADGARFGLTAHAVSNEVSRRSVGDRRDALINADRRDAALAILDEAIARLERAEPEAAPTEPEREAVLA